MATTNITKLYVALDGTLVKQVNTSITRGNDSINQIQYITPFDTSFTMECNFQLFNGEIVSAKPLTLRGTEELDIGSIYDGETWNVKGYDVESAILSTLSKLVASPLYTTATVKEANPDYLGSYADETAINAITGMVEDDYVFNVDTDTSWEYDGADWADLLFEKTIWSSVQSIPASTVELSVNPSIISSTEEISQTAVELLTAWLNDIETELAKLKTQADGAFEPANDDVWSSDKRVQTLLDNYYMATANYDTAGTESVRASRNMETSTGVNVSTALEVATTVGRVDQDLKTTASPEFATVVMDELRLNGDVAIGSQTWNNTEDCIDTIINANVTLQNGRELLKLGRNTSGSTITNGSVVAIIGSVGNVAEIELLDISDANQSFKVIGMATEAITNNSVGNINLIGRVRGLDTSAWAEGTILYANASGGLTSTCPTKGLRCVLMAVVETSNAGNGIVWQFP